MVYIMALDFFGMYFYLRLLKCGHLRIIKMIAYCNVV